MCSNVDCSEILSYDTVKIIRIYDRRLGLLHYGLMFLILIYVLGYTVIYEKRYVTTLAPAGSVRLSLLAPTKRSPASSLLYCLKNGTNPKVPYTNPNQDNPGPSTNPNQDGPYTNHNKDNPGPSTNPNQDGPYTNHNQDNPGPSTNPNQDNPIPSTNPNQDNPIPSTNPKVNNSPSIPPNMTFPCVYYDEKLVLLPTPFQERSIFVSTRITITTQTLNHSCSLFDPNCVYVTVGQVPTLYVADIENFTIMIDHTISDTYDVGDVPDLAGTLYDSQQKVMTLKDPDRFGQKGLFDVLQVGTLLRAAGINSLDELSTNRPYYTKRYEGLVIVLLIQYTNMFSFDLGNTQYFASVTVIPKAYFKVEQPLYPQNTSLHSRAIWNRHGIRMIVLQNGVLGRFDFPSMLLSFVSGLGLVAVSTVIVDILATKILPQKEVYTRHKYSSIKEIGVLEKTEVIKEDGDPGEYGTFGRKFES